MNKPVWWKAVFVSAAAMLALSGCGAGGDGADGGTEGVQQQGQQTYDIAKNRRANGKRDLGPLRNDRTDFIQANDPQARPFYNPLTNERLSMRELTVDLEANDELADQLTALDEVRRAGVLTVGGNAYVGVVLAKPRSGNMTASLKDDIAQKVKSLNPNIENVYVSANPGFLQRFDRIADHMRRGRAVEGIIDEFNAMVQNVFPAEAGDADNRARNRAERGNRATGTGGNGRANGR